jgi:hypothetical protein
MPLLKRNQYPNATNITSPKNIAERNPQKYKYRDPLRLILGISSKLTGKYTFFPLHLRTNLTPEGCE